MFLQHETNQIEKAIKIKWALNICGGRSIQRSGFHIHLNTFLCILKSEKSKQHINLHYLGFADVCLKIEFMKIRKKHQYRIKVRSPKRQFNQYYATLFDSNVVKKRSNDGWKINNKHITYRSILFSWLNNIYSDPFLPIFTLFVCVWGSETDKNKYRFMKNVLGMYKMT